MSKIEGVSVAVVGGAGFLGSHLVNYLVEQRNCEVYVLDNLQVGRREWIHPKAHFLWEDITHSEDRLRHIFQGTNAQYVFNYAAEPYIPVSFKRPLHVCDVNFMGAIKVINAAQEAGVNGILQVSSAEIYGEGCVVNTTTETNEQFYTHTLGKIDEETLVKPHSTYGAAKAAIDALIQVRWKEAKTPCIALRQFNCIGERETHPYVVPEIISQLSAWAEHTTDKIQPVVKLGNNSFRDFQYAGNAVRNAVLLLESERYGEVFNMGSEEGVKVYELPTRVAQIMGLPEPIILEDEGRKRPWEIWHLQSNNTKLWATIGHQTSMPLESALYHTVEDFYQNGNKWSWEK